MNEPIVSKDVVREQARAAAEAGETAHVNPYPPGSSAALCWDHHYHERHRELTEIEA
jgi:hypothetical protein